MKKQSKLYLSKVSDLGCIVCLLHLDVFSPAEIHHIRDGNVGVGQRADDDEALPLCHRHHRTGGYGVAFHAGKKTWENKFGTQRELLEEVHKRVSTG